jgi:hypothetical protein
MPERAPVIKTTGVFIVSSLESSLRGPSDDKYGQHEHRQSKVLATNISQKNCDKPLLAFTLIFEAEAKKK